LGAPSIERFLLDGWETTNLGMASVRISFLSILLALASLAIQAQQPAEKPQPTQQSGADAHISKGTQLLHDQLYEAAAKEFEQAAALEPKNAEAHFEDAVCLLALGRNDDARTQFELVEKLKGPSRYVTYYLGRLDLLANDYASAVKRLNTVAANPPFADTDFYLGVAYVSSGDTQKGIAWLEKAVKLTPGDYRVHYRLARAYSTAGREQDAAHEYALYNQYLSQHKSTETDARACSEALRTQATDAHDVCQHMYDPNDPEKLTLLGQLYGEAGAFAQALGPLNRAVELDPGSYEAWHDLGLTYFKLARYADARGPLIKAARLRPENYGTVVMLGATLYMLGDDAAALPVLEHAHQLNPSDEQTTAILDKLRNEQQKK
jgi:Flp pilus assembly protein TadD